jgi:hypothetical protein
VKWPGSKIFVVRWVLVEGDLRSVMGGVACCGCVMKLSA